jgi:beta-glucanase (GH16 family)
MKTSAKVLMQPFVILVLIAGALGLGLPIQSAIAKPAAQTTNLALNKPVTCSPTPQFPCAEAVDGNLGTRWASAQGVDPQWIYVDLGATYTVSSVILRWEAAYATAFQIQTSGAAGGPWTNIYSTTTGTGGVQTLTVSGSGRYVRMNGTARATIYGYSLWEFEVYGTSGGATATRTNTPLGPTATRTNTPLGPTATRTNTPSGSTNLALNKPVTCSSIENAGTPCASAVDGNTGTRWSSAASDPQWIYVDLGATATIGQVILRWETAYASAFQIQTSGAAGGPWTNIYSTTTGTGGTQTINVSGSGRYIRMYGTTRATVWGYSLWEFEVYGTGGATATNTPVGPSNTPVPPTPTRTPTSPSGGSCGTTSNIALNHPAYAWYWDTGGGAPQYAVDGNGTTRYSHLWYPSGPATGWWYVDLGSTAATITGINITWETAVASGFNLQVSNDTVNWTTIQTVSGNTSLTTNYTYSPARVGRYVRINLLTKGTAWGYSFFEFQVIGCNGAAASYTPTPGPLSGTYSLVWSDNFDGTALNTSNWAYDNNVHVNGEAQQYVSNNVTVSGGILRITAKKEINNGYQFTSGRIFTHHLKTWKYGKFIARMLLPVGEGYWPAFWMMGEDIDTVGWPGTGETDIMENIGYANWVSGALHGPGYWGAGSIGGQHILPNGGTIAAWHDYAVEWDPTYIKWYIDNILVRTVNRTDVTANGSQWVYGNNKFILLNLALGGEYPAGYNGCTGSPLPAGCPYFGIKQATVDNIVAGQGVVQVDYVQVWQKP